MTAGRLGRSYHKLFAASTISNLGDGIGLIAYPWLASAVTRDPLLVALVAAVQRLPWLLFSLPAGVITDRYDRRSLMVGSNITRAILTLAVAAMVVGQGNGLPGPGQLDDANLVINTNSTLYIVVLGATFLLGTAEVLYDNTAQTIMPSLVDEAHLEKANGRLWSAEQVTNTVGGPAAGAALLALAFAAPFFVDALTFALSALLVYSIPRPSPKPKAVGDRKPWKEELSEGFQWLWHHELLRPLAITLGLLNMVFTLSMAAFVLFAPRGAGHLTGRVCDRVNRWCRRRDHQRVDRFGGLPASRIRTFTVADARRWRPDNHHHRCHLAVARGLADVCAVDVCRRAVECDHGFASPVDHPRPSARAGKQRLPVLCVGHDSHRRSPRWAHRCRRGAIRFPRTWITPALVGRRRRPDRAAWVRRTAPHDCPHSSSSRPS